MAFPIIFENADMKIRHIIKQDMNDFVSLITLPAYGRLSPFGALSKPEAEKLAQKLIDIEHHKTTFWTVTHHQEYAGFVGYQSVIFEEKPEEMLYLGFNRKYWGSELPLMAAKSACEFAFKFGHISRLIAFVHPEDVESIYVAQSLGSTFLKQCLFFDAMVMLFFFDSSNVVS